MTPEPAARPAQRHRITRIANIGAAPRALVAYFVAIEVVAVIWVTVEAFSAPLVLGDLGRSLLIIGLAVGFEEGTRGVASLRLRLSEHLKPDMTTVWTAAAAIVLPPAYAAGCVITLLIYMYLRLQRPAGEQLYRKILTGATIVLSCLVVSQVIENLTSYEIGIGPGMGAALAAGLALLAYTATNRLLVTGGLVLL
ncbi:MAG: hypothetical protein JWO57_2764, partial [Pseudonocardiales bacterium]|nr:hypothetical protein [Pseudonocardiales bacterium]